LVQGDYAQGVSGAFGEVQLEGTAKAHPERVGLRSGQCRGLAGERGQVTSHCAQAENLVQRAGR